MTRPWNAICEVAGHAWATMTDAWGRWQECQRCHEKRPLERVEGGKG